MDRAVDGVLCHSLKHRFQKGDELRLLHLAAAHREIAMSEPTKTRDVVLDRNVVRGVRERELRLVTFEQALVDGPIASITAQEAVAAKPPHVSGLADRRTRGILRHIIFRAP